MNGTRKVVRDIKQLFYVGQEINGSGDPFYTSTQHCVSSSGGRLNKWMGGKPGCRGISKGVAIKAIVITSSLNMSLLTYNISQNCVLISAHQTQIQPVGCLLLYI